MVRPHKKQKKKTHKHYHNDKIPAHKTVELQMQQSCENVLEKKCTFF